MEYFRNKIIWITGASAGIGEEMAIQMGKAGAHLALSARRKDRLEELAGKLRDQNVRAGVYPCDVTSDEEVRVTADQIVSDFGGMDMVIANAGYGTVGSVKRLTADDWKRQFEVNVFGLIRTVRQALPYIIEARGHVVLMSSVAAMISVPRGSAYAASKAAVRQIGNTLSMELSGTGACCTTLYPGFIESEIGHVNNQGEFDPEQRDIRPEKLMWPTDKAVRVMLKKIAKKKRSAVITGHGKAFAFLGRHFPGLVHWLTVHNHFGTVKKS